MHQRNTVGDATHSLILLGYSEASVREALKVSGGDVATAQEVLQAWQRVPPPQLTETAPEVTREPPSASTMDSQAMVEQAANVAKEGASWLRNSWWRGSVALEELATSADDQFKAMFKTSKAPTLQHRKSRDSFEQFFDYSPSEAQVVATMNGADSAVQSVREEEKVKNRPSQAVYLPDHDQGVPSADSAEAEFDDDLGLDAVTASAEKAWGALCKMANLFPVDVVGLGRSSGVDNKVIRRRSTTLPQSGGVARRDDAKRQQEISALLSQGWMPPESVRRLKQELHELHCRTNRGEEQPEHIPGYRRMTTQVTDHVQGIGASSSTASVPSMSTPFLSRCPSYITAPKAARPADSISVATPIVTASAVLPFTTAPTIEMASVLTGAGTMTRSPSLPSVGPATSEPPAEPKCVAPPPKGPPPKPPGPPPSQPPEPQKMEEENKPVPQDGPAPPPAAKSKSGKAPPVPRPKLPPKAKSKAAALPKETPLGRRFDWRLLTKDKVAGTVFEDLTGPVSGHVRVDVQCLRALFEKPKEPPTAKKGGTPRKSEVTLLSHSRAQNMMIALRRQPLTPEIYQALVTMDFQSEVLTPEACEVLSGAIPTAEESKLLLGFLGDSVKLREVERKVLPFAKLTRPPAGQRLRLAMFGRIKDEISSDVKGGLDKLKAAFTDTRGSLAFRTVLRHTARLGSVINFGVAQADTDVAAGFSLEALTKLALFKAANNSRITLLHVLVAQVCAADKDLPGFLVTDLGEMRRVVKRPLAQLAEEVGAFNREVEHASSCASLQVFVDQAETSGSNCMSCRMQHFAEEASATAANLKEDLKSARSAAKAALTYFAVPASEKEVDNKSHELSTLLCDFLDGFSKCQEELAANPALAAACHSGALGAGVENEADSPETQPENKSVEAAQPSDQEPAPEQTPEIA